MRCPSCGTENRLGARFCRQCAGLLSAGQAGAVQVCPNCGAQVSSDTKFCLACGVSLERAKPSVARPEPPPPPVWSAPPPAMPSPEEPRRGIGGCAWVLVAGGVLGGLLLVVAIAVGVLLATQGGIPGLFPSPTPTETSTPIPTDTPPPTNTPTSTSTPTSTPTALPTDTPFPTLTLTPPPAFPQECGMTEATADYGPIELGSMVVLGRHREVNGDDNWAGGMDAYVGKVASVEKFSGVDAQGCPGIRVDIDEGAWFWRVRDLSLP